LMCVRWNGINDRIARAGFSAASFPRHGGMMQALLSPQAGNAVSGLVRKGSNLGRMTLLSVAVGVTCGLAARGLETALQMGTRTIIGSVANPGGAGILRFNWLVLLYPALGGLISGLLVGLFCRPTRAHGTAVLVDAFHHLGAELSLRDSVLKAFAALAVISLGGSVGKEAVIAVLGAAIGTSYAGWLGMTPRQRRLFLIAGCAAGVGAIFQCPLGGAIFATTVLYREPEIEADALMPALIASVVSFSTFRVFGGQGSRLLHGADGLAFTKPIELAAYAALALLCAAAGILFYYCIAATQRLVRARRLPRWLAPALAGVVVGGIACAFPQVMDSRYQFVQQALDGTSAGLHSWPGWTLIFGLVIVAKCLATGAMVGADTAGGLFGPVIFMGGVTGALTGAFLTAFFPGTFPEELRESLIAVGMAGVLSAALRTPLAAIVMVMEMTGSYGLIVPLMLVSVVAYVAGRWWGVYPEQVGGPMESPAHAGETLVTVLENARVRDVAKTVWPFVVQPGTSLPQLLAMLPEGARPEFAVVEGQRLAGVISTADISRVVDLGIAQGAIVAADILRPAPAVLYPDDDLYGTLDIFRRHNLDALPVVQGANADFAGMLTCREILQFLRQHLSGQREQLLREHAGFASLNQEALLAALLSEFPDPQGEQVRRMNVPEEAVGKSLRQSDFRRRHSVQVIAIETAKGELLSPPDPDRPLNKGEVLIVLPMLR